MVVDDPAAAEGHADVAAADEAAVDRGVESFADGIVLMEQVHEMTAGQGDGAVPVAGEPESAVVRDDLDAARRIDRAHEPLDRARR